MDNKKTGKRLLTLALALMLCMTAMVCPAMAAEQEVEVRVNGYLVNFPDQKPIVNSDSRTLIPVRFVAEELGAEVNWDGKQQAAVIEKDGMTITIPIGEKNMKVTDANGKTSTVTMDTEAVVKNGRTLVPIRFVAEAMGCWVGFSSSFQTVHIYKDVLTPDEIDAIHNLSYGWEFDSSTMKYKNSSTTFEDMHEVAFRPTTFVVDSTIKNVYDGQSWNSKKDTTEKLANLFVNYATEAVASRFTYKDYGVKATFRTDASAISNCPTDSTATPYIIYGYLTITFDDDADIAKYKKFYGSADFGNVQAGKSYTYLIETFWMTNAITSTPAPMGTWNRTNGVRDQWN